MVAEGKQDTTVEEFKEEVEEEGLFIGNIIDNILKKIFEDLEKVKMATGVKINKMPPIFKDDMDFLSWKNDIDVWLLFTDIDKTKHGPAIYLALEGKAREAVRDIDKQKLSSDEGASAIIEALEKVYLKDENTRAYLAFKNFYNFKRTAGMTIIDFITQYEKLYGEMKKFNMVLPEAVQAFMLLNAVNISDEIEKLARATLTTITYNEMKAKILRIFAESSDEAEAAPDVKEESSEVLYTKYNTFGKRGRGRGVRGGRMNYRGIGNRSTEEKSTAEESGKECFICKSKDHLSYRCPKNDNRLRCFACGSPEHLADKCPNRSEKKEDQSEQVNYTLMTLKYPALTPNEGNNKLSALVRDTLGMGLLDSGCTKTVVGEKWMSIYIEMLDEKDACKVIQKDDSASFQFGDGAKVVSKKKVLFPAVIGKKEITIEANVVSNDIPLLLSRDSMKRADTVMCFGSDKARMCGEEIDLFSTSCGHYCIPLLPTVNCQMSIKSMKNFVLHISEEFKKLPR